MFVSCGGMVQHTVGMMVDPVKQGTFVMGIYPQGDFNEIQDRYTEVKLPDSYREKLLDLDTYRERKLHELCEDLLVQVIRNGDRE